MNTPSIAPPPFHVFTGRQVHDVLHDRKRDVLHAVERAYRAHACGRTHNPDSQFLHFPLAQRNRVIALPAHIGEDSEDAAIGIKWIASFPDNIRHGIPRASAALILNDPATGYPMACMEASIISASRTAASAVSALRLLAVERAGKPHVVAFIGAGLIARYVAQYLPLAGVCIERIVMHDVEPRYAEALAERVHREQGFATATEASIGRAIGCADVVVFCTTAATPHVFDATLLAHAPIVLHLSLRDLSSDLILSCHNIVDDADHCLKASTSLQLTHQQTGRRDFITTSLPEMLCGGEVPARDKAVVFSPFGMGVLDIAVAQMVYRTLAPTQPSISQFHFDVERG